MFEIAFSLTSVFFSWNFLDVPTISKLWSCGRPCVCAPWSRLPYAHPMMDDPPALV